MKKIMVLALSFIGCLTAMEQQPEPYNGLIFLTIDNKTNKDWKIKFLGHREAKIENHTKRFIPEALPMETGLFVAQFEDLPSIGMMTAALNFFIERFESGAIEFQLAPRRAGPIKQRFTFDPAAKDDAYAVKVALEGKDYLEKSSFEVVQIKNAKFVQLLKKYKSNINGRGHENSTPLMELFYEDPSFTTQELREVVPFLIKAGANLNAQTKDGWAALHLIASVLRNDLLGIARLLLEAGANPNIQNENGNTPLLLALIHKKNDIAKLLINSGVNVNVGNNNGARPLNLAILKGNIDLARLLIQKGADLNAKSNGGYTPLHIAVHEGNIEMVKLLVDEGAKLTEKDNQGRTPIGQAALEIEAGHEVEKMKPIYDLLAKALAESQKRYVKGWKQKFKSLAIVCIQLSLN